MPAAFDNWSGGIADSYLSEGDNRAARLDNFLLDESGKPYVRSGFFCVDPRVTTSIGSTRISGVYLGSIPFIRPMVFRGPSVYFLDSTDAWDEISGPALNDACPTKTHTQLESCIEWRKQLVYTVPPTTVLPHRIYCDDDDPDYTFIALTLGLPALASTPTATSGGGTGNNYVYAFHYSYEFTDFDGTLFEEAGPVVFRELANAGAPDANNVAIAAIPTLANTASTNYDVAAVKVKIYRTKNNGITYYYIGEVTNGDPDYTDAASDDSLDTEEVLYTDGGILENTQPPAASKYVTQVNDFFWFATDRLLIHSKQGAPGACPAEYEYPTDQKVRGLGKVIGFPILFCDRSVYRVEGVFDEFGDGSFELREISGTAGCVGHKSIVTVPGGLVWAGNDGFYFTNGYQVQRISDSISERYKIWRNEGMSGCYDSGLNMVHWTISSSENSWVNPNDSLASLHLDFGLKEASTFTTQRSANNIFPCAVAYSASLDVEEVYRSKLLVGEAKGYLLYQDEKAYTDPNLDLIYYVSEQPRKTIEYYLEQTAASLDGPNTRSWVTEIKYELKNVTDVAAQFLSRRDDGGPWAELSEFKTNGAILWGISEVPWDDEVNDPYEHDWDSQPLIQGHRHFPKGSLRSNRRQVALTNATTWITKSDDLGTATIDALARTITLDDTTKRWPDDCVDYDVVFLSGYTTGTEYNQSFRVKVRQSDTVVEVFDPYAALTNQTAIEWQMRGKRKHERLYLLSFRIDSQEDGNTQAPNRGVSGDVNA